MPRLLPLLRVTLLRAALLGLGLLAAPAAALDPRAILFHAARADAELAAGRPESAYRRLRWLALNDAGDTRRTDAYLTALQQIRRDRPLGFAAGLAVLPSTNIARTSSHDRFETGVGTFDLADEREKSGLGLRLDTAANATSAYAPGRELGLRISLGGAWYDDPALRLVTGALALSHTWILPRRTWTVAALASATAYPAHDADSAPDWQGAGAALSATRALSDAGTLRGSVLVQYRDFETRDYMDGPFAALDLSYSRLVSPRARVTLSAGLDRARTRADHYAYGAASLGLGYRRATRSGLTWEAGAGAELRGFDADFTALTHPREDRIYDLSLALSHEKLRVLDTQPRLECTARFHESNVALYDYDSLDCALSLRQDF
ncbi:surface lipoprotein assembly modifier [Celeribacter indicus]|nr:surface lipoprotein assembly modifier [Celeribacter indicus]SDW55266.1 Protein of unknown function [Celeribacter indicus]